MLYLDRREREHALYRAHILAMKAGGFTMLPLGHPRDPTVTVETCDNKLCIKCRRELHSIVQAAGLSQFEMSEVFEDLPATPPA